MRIPLLSLAAISIVLAGCGHETAPTAPEASLAPQSMQAGAIAVPMAQSKLDGLWPNEDGRSWSYVYRFEHNEFSMPTLYPTKEEVPDAPTPEEILPLLETSPDFATVENGIYGLVFQGQTTTASGATGQNLVESLGPAGGASGRIAPSFRERLLARLTRVRPDMRGRIATLSARPDDLDQLPLLIHGGAWEKTLEHIGTYGDVDRELAWQFLGADTKQGATFTFQLVPSLADDVFLTAWVVPHRLRSEGSKGRAVEVAYVIDYGISDARGPSGEPLGYSHAVGYGTVTYVPGVGPIAAIERPIVSIDQLANPDGQIT